MISENEILGSLESYSPLHDLKTDPDYRVICEHHAINGYKLPYFYGEFWTARQRQASSIHEISYRACFKPQLPRFFIELLSKPGDIVYDPFAGRGTTTIEAALLGRAVIANDVNPLSRILSEPRLSVPSLDMIERGLAKIPFNGNIDNEINLSMFYHPDTEAELLDLRSYLDSGLKNGTTDKCDRWIRMIATNRLSGHSPGFFSVYTMPPNQTVSAERQKKINLKLNQKPSYRDVRAIILKKSVQLLRNLKDSELKYLHRASQTALFLEQDAANTGDIADNTVNLTVTSPPFMNVVQYSQDNWLRCWFNNISIEDLERRLTITSSPEQWSTAMSTVFKEIFRITKPGGWVAFEVGEIEKGKINLEELVVPLGLEAGFHCSTIVVNKQRFTKTSKIWGIDNNSFGTNSNRIILFNKKLQGMNPVIK